MSAQNPAPTIRKIAIVAGGNRGIGRSTVLNLAKQKVDSIFIYRSHREEADALISEVSGLGARAIALPLDADLSAASTRL